MLTDETRFKVEFLATLVHEGTVQPLNMWLHAAPPLAEAFVEQLLRDELAYLVRVRDDDDALAAIYDDDARLATHEALELIHSGSAQDADDVVLAPAQRAFAFKAPGPLFAYAERREL